ncbi:MAG: potassium channel family protein [Acidimicrobiales bacterium]
MWSPGKYRIRIFVGSDPLSGKPRQVERAVDVKVLRLARLARLVIASKGSRRLFDRLGRVALFAGLVVIVGALVAYHAERPVNPEFATLGDSLWWGIVTLTTVGYGDIVPKTPVGRWVAVTIMITGIAVLGMLSGSLASFFRIETPDATPTDESSSAAAATRGDAPASGASPLETALLALTLEVSAFRQPVEALAQRLTGGTPDSTATRGAPEGDEPP